MTEHAYAAPAGIYGPVTDWATDLDHADPSYNPRAPEIWAELRESGCPVAHSDRYNGMWAPITAELVREVAYDTDHFTSRAVVVSTSIIEAVRPIGAAPPITSDPPFHALARRLLLPPFVPKQIEPWEPEIRKLCRERLDDMGPITAGETVVDAAQQYAQHIPVNVIARMLGLPAGGRRPVPGVRPRRAGRRQPRARGAPGRLREARRLHRRADRVPPRRATRRPHVVPPRCRAGRPEAVARARPRLDRAAADRRHRHDVERDRFEPVAPGVAPRGSSPAGGGTRADADGDRGAAAGVRPGDDGPHGRRGPRLPRLPDEGRRVGAAAVPCGQPRSGAVRTCRRGRHRPAGEPPRRLRPGDPSLPRIQPRPPRAARSPSRSSSPGSPSSSWPTRTPSGGASARSAARASCPCASSPDSVEYVLPVEYVVPG